MNPTSPSAAPVPTPPVVGTDLVEYMRTNRDRTSYILLALSVVFLAVTILMAVKAFQVPAGAKKDDKKEEVTNPFDPLSKDADKKADIANPKRSSYLLGGIGGLAAFLVTASAGAWVLVGLPNPSEEKQRSEARKLILIVGGCIGAAVVFVGIALFYMWSDSLSAWLDKDEKKQAKWVMIPLTMIITGAGLVFLSAQPARAEERNNSALRRMVYGANFGLTILLVLVLLIVGNVVFALKAPNMLDATATGFYTLSPTTKGFMGQLKEPVTAYMVMQESGDRVTTDMRQVLIGFQDAGGGKFSVRFLNPVTDKQEIRRLSGIYKKLEPDSEGILLVVGPEDQPDKQHTAFISERELVQQQGGGMPGAKSAWAFVGEGRILRDLRFLLESETKPVVYFTQSNGELSIGGGPRKDLSSVPGSQLVQFLNSHYSLEIKPLTFPASEPNPKVPDDCGVLVVADPQKTLSDPVVAAIRRYMAEKKGRLLVLSGATPAFFGLPINRTGLEGLLGEYNVGLGNQVIYASPQTKGLLDPLILPVSINSDSAAKQHQIAQSVSSGPNRYRFPLSKEVRAITGSPNFQAVAIVQTQPGIETWLEDDLLPDVDQTWSFLVRSDVLKNQRQLIDSPRPVMVAVSEGGTGRVVVIGNGLAFGDNIGQQLRTGTTAYDLVGASIDWLRDRPPIPGGVESKTYQEYNFPDPVSVDYTRLLYLPIIIAILTVSGLGAGVWVVRRK